MIGENVWLKKFGSQMWPKNYFTVFVVSTFVESTFIDVVVSTLVTVESFVSVVVDSEPHDANTIVVKAISIKPYFLISLNIKKNIQKTKLFTNY